jgi:predicted nuclease of restriction endonuclease-like (RecB) superfamily
MIPFAPTTNQRFVCMSRIKVNQINKELTPTNLETNVSIIEMIKTAQSDVRQFTNTTLVSLYFKIGKIVSHRVNISAWGMGTVQNLADQIQAELPTLKSFNRRGLYRMKQFYETYCIDSELYKFVQTYDNQILNSKFLNVSAMPTHLKTTEIIHSQKAELGVLSTLSIQVSWAVHLEILSSCSSPEEILFYLLMATKEKWTQREIRRQLESAYYERFLLSKSIQAQLNNTYSRQSSEYLKDIYSLEFLNLDYNFSEHDLQKSILKNLQKFILEIGTDFSFVGNEYKVQVANKDYQVDLLFYHRTLQCLVAFELKITEFKPEYLGKMNFYLEALDREHKQKHENPSIGVILCKSVNQEIVEIAMSRSLSATRVAEFTTKLIDKTLLQQKLKELGDYYMQSKNIEPN